MPGILWEFHGGRWNGGLRNVVLVTAFAYHPGNGFGAPSRMEVVP